MKVLKITASACKIKVYRFKQAAVKVEHAYSRKLRSSTHNHDKNYAHSKIKGDRNDTHEGVLLGILESISLGKSVGAVGTTVVGFLKVGWNVGKVVGALLLGSEIGLLEVGDKAGASEGGVVGVNLAGEEEGDTVTGVRVVGKEGNAVGEAVGIKVGVSEEDVVTGVRVAGKEEGETVTGVRVVGKEEGNAVGEAVGIKVGVSEGDAVTRDIVGKNEGLKDGDTDTGREEGAVVGDEVGLLVGIEVVGPIMLGRLVKRKQCWEMITKLATK
jgi:hypothetical protein